MDTVEMNVFKKEEDWLIENLKGKDGVVQVVKVESMLATSKGDNYTSDIIRMKTEVLLEDGSIRNRSYILKKQTLDIGDIFGTEIKMYTDVLPKMENLMKLKDKEDEPMWCKLICSNEDSSVLVFEDLKEQGYSPTNRLAGLDIYDCLLIVRELGKFHALGAALLERGQVNLEDFSKWELRENETLSKNMISSAITCLVKVMRDSWDQKEWGDIIQKLEDLIPNCCDKFFKIYDDQPKSNALRVLAHGDCWACNLMIKYSPANGAPIGVKFLDFQVSHISTFGWDLCYFLHTSLKPEIRRQNWSKLTQTYLDSLRKYLRILGVPEERIPKMSDLESEIKRVEYWGFILTIGFLPATLSPPGEPFNVDCLKDDTNKLLNLNLYKNPKFIFGVQEDLKRFAQNGVIDPLLTS